MYRKNETDTEILNSLLLAGIDQETIAKILKINVKTLSKHYKDEILETKSLANAKVAGVAYKMAISGQHPAMTIFWLKTQLRWTELSKTEITALDKQQLVPVINITDYEPDETDVS